MRRVLIIWFALLVVFASGCCKDKKSCVGIPFQVQPFFEGFFSFECNNNNEYTYIFRKKAQIDSLRPTCFTTGPIAYPLDDINMIYFMVGRYGQHFNDTFQTKLWKDTCLKTLVYEVNMIQRDTAYYRGGGGVIIDSGVIPIFCSIDNIPSNYQVSVKYKYVPK